ncbi:SfnB family sulfur acquisition oxidoreductase [Nonomuraea jabiensis]|uniref:SfnB family sulfur acquisition oxidoreductase n=1 Tax=Nonomuraea jabiensis TaxID=882448 RepID=A0A7W9GGN2_9ACTN|nr:SfnB family sulfur acquisition oxidoreductase [Nonomuraea jabiensis]MBB5783246.1 SfnB family sulfur acquisition oxidoreductase [Nonomuraea jabiensis]
MTTHLTDAHVIASDEEALRVAADVADKIGATAAQRDRDRSIPTDEVELIRAGGLLGITIPRVHGGAGVSTRTLAEVTRLLAQADPSIGQIPQNHYVALDIVRLVGDEAQRAFFAAEVLRGRWLGNATSERGRKLGLTNIGTRLTPAGDGSGDHLVTGTKYYSTGAYTSQWIPVMALNPDDRLVVAMVERHAPGVEVVHDWTAFGQRSTISGTTTLSDVRVPRERVLPRWRIFERPQVHGAYGQILHAAVDLGIADAALADATGYVTERTRPWWESGVENAADEPYLIGHVGRLDVRRRAAHALVRQAAETLDAANSVLGDPGVPLAERERVAGEASLAVAAAKVFAAEVSVKLSNELFELAGTSSTDEKYALDRHWRNARTHTLHDPKRWKYHHLGVHALHGRFPPNHGGI